MEGSADTIRACAGGVDGKAVLIKRVADVTGGDRVGVDDDRGGVFHETTSGWQDRWVLAPQDRPGS